MKVKLYVPMAGTLSVEVEDEVALLSLQDLVTTPVEVEFPRPVVIEVDEPMQTGLIIVPNV